MITAAAIFVIVAFVVVVVVVGEWLPVLLKVDSRIYPASWDARDEKGKVGVGCEDWGQDREESGWSACEDGGCWGGDGGD